MEYALVNNERSKAMPKLKGYCPACNELVISKCGKIKIWHWAHLGKRDCDSWSEGETDWHLYWKNHFDPEYQEVIVKNDNVIHRADIRLVNGLVIEIQNSPIKPEEIDKRNAFYKNVVWILNGKRLISDYEKIQGLLRQKTSESKLIKITNLGFYFTRTWKNSNTPLIIDFGEFEELEISPIFLFIQSHDKKEKFLYRLDKKHFIDSLRDKNTISSFIEEAENLINKDFSISNTSTPLTHNFKSPPVKMPNYNIVQARTKNCRQLGWNVPLFFYMLPKVSWSIDEYFNSLVAESIFAENKYSKFRLVEIVKQIPQNLFAVNLMETTSKLKYRLEVKHQDNYFLHDFALIP